MAYIVTEPCVNCRYTDCVPVCPVEAGIWAKVAAKGEHLEVA